MTQDGRSFGLGVDHDDGDERRHDQHVDRLVLRELASSGATSVTRRIDVGPSNTKNLQATYVDSTGHEHEAVRSATPISVVKLLHAPKLRAES